MLQTMLSNKLNACKRSFIDWFESECVNKVLQPAKEEEFSFSTPQSPSNALIMKEYFNDNKTGALFCCLYWINTTQLHQYPHGCNVCPELFK